MWIDSFRARVETHPDRIALVTQQRSTTYGELWRGAEAAGRDGGHSVGMRRVIVEAEVQTALEAALDTEGFFQTVDLMRMDADGYLFNLGRIGRLVKVSGWMTNPAEVEGVLCGLPGVAEALCWSVPHDLLGNVLHAMVVPERGAVLDVQALRKACRSQLERHKVPHNLQVVAQLPQTPTGKVMLRPTGQS